MRLISYDAHVNMSDPGSTAGSSELVKAAEAVGLEAIALVVVPSSLEASPEDHVRRLEAVGHTSTIRVVPALQTEILDTSGRLSASEQVCNTFPLVLAHLSAATEGVGCRVPVRWEKLLDNIFSSLIEAVSSGQINVVAYPFNLGRSEAPIAPAQLPTERVEQLGDAMAAAGVVCELCNQTWWWYPQLSVVEFTEEFAPVLQAFSRCGVKFIAGSDCHSPQGVGNLRYVQRLMRRCGIERSQLVDLARL